MTEPAKLKRYNILKEFSLGIEAVPFIQYPGSQVDLTDEQAEKWADYVELTPDLGDRTHIVVVRDAELEGKTLKLGEKVVLSPGNARLLGSKVIDIEDQLDEKDKVKDITGKEKKDNK